MKVETKKVLAVAAFCVATFIAIVSLFIEPYGIIDTSALWAVCQFLIMACTLLGIDATLIKYMQAHEKNH